MENFTHLGINFNSETMQFEVGPTDWQRKAGMIADISTIQESLGKGCITPEQWDTFIDMGIDELQRIIDDQSELLARHREKSQPQDEDEE